MMTSPTGRLPRLGDAANAAMRLCCRCSGRSSGCRHAGPDPLRPAERRRRAERQHRRAARVSYDPLINRLTQEGGVPYFLSVGNHDVGNCRPISDDRRRRSGIAQLLRGERAADSRRRITATARGLSDLRLRLRQHVLHRLRLEHPGRLGAVRLGEARSSSRSTGAAT